MYPPCNFEPSFSRTVPLTQHKLIPRSSSHTPVSASPISIVEIMAASATPIQSQSNNDNPNESKLTDLLTRATTLFGTTSTGSSSIEEFCTLVKSEPEGPQITLRLLAHKLQSPVESEAMAALDVLQRCVETCGPTFHSEIGKFRFLNEIVKVISPKYFGVYTSPRVKDRCIEMMYGWTKTLKSEPKIAEAYEMLKKQGLLRIDPAARELEAEAAKKAAETEKQRVSAASAGSSVLGLPETPKTRSSEPRKPILDDDRAKTLKLLLQSKRPEDLAAANQLIKESLKQDQERVERHSKRHAELDIVRNNMTLLTDMLDHYEESLMAQTQDTRTPKNSSSDSDTDIDVMAELYMMLDKHRPALFRMASEVEDTEDDMLAALLRANDDLLEVLARYRHLVNGEPMTMVAAHMRPKPKSSSSKDQSNSSFLVDVADILSSPPAAVAGHSPNQNAVADLLGQEFAAVGLPPPNLQSKNGEEAKNAFKEFSTNQSKSSGGLDSELISLEGLQITSSNHHVPSAPASVQKILDSIAVSQATSLMQQTESSGPQPKKPQAKQMDALDLLGQEAIQKHLPEKVEKVNKSSSSNKAEPVPAASTCLLDSEDLLPNAVESEKPKEEPPKKQQTADITLSSNAKTDLNELTFSLDRFRPLSSTSPLVLYQKNGVNVLLLQNGAVEPSHPANVKVFLASTNSMAADAISNFKMTFSVHAKQANLSHIRPLEPSATSLAAFNPIMPPAVVTQIILAEFTAPYPDSLKLRFEISYRLRDTCYSESGIEEIPLSFESLS